ncbi:MAG TPA: methyltransferase domain-containing protein [Desulfomonilaceae bacterium]|nr:methyltransferase domain-containing protein [Desulfomonilaceae bacterium]
MTSVLLVNHSGEKCGVYQFGSRLFSVLRCSDKFRWIYADVRDENDFVRCVQAENPDAVIFNSYGALTMPWLTLDVLNAVHAVKFCVFHEGCQELADAAVPAGFDFYLVPDPYLIPRNPLILPVPRFTAMPLTELPPQPPVFTIGSFGFGTPSKGFDRLCALVNEQFDRAVVRINIPLHDRKDIVGDRELKGIEKAARRAITKSGIQLILTHDFLDDEGLLRFLAGNSLNAFLYTATGMRGISSCLDYALVAGRPIAVSRSTMFRHLHGLNPSVCVEDLSLRQIFENGTTHLEPLCRAFSPTVAAAQWAGAIDEGMARHALRRSSPDGRGFNKILDDRSRHAYSEALDDVRRLAPDIMARKISGSEIQQAFALDTVERVSRTFENPRILAIGSYEDPTVATLRAKGYRIRDIDPGIDLDLNDFYLSPESQPESYNIILCVSVLEHVEHDALFVQQVADLLEPGGVAVFTVDFREAYMAGDAKPGVDFRLYTSYDFLSRLMPVVPDCGLLDNPSWGDGAPDFTYEDTTYNFASWVFRKVPLLPFEHKDGAFTRLRTTPWKSQLVVPLPPDMMSSGEDSPFFPEYRPRFANAQHHVLSAVIESLYQGLINRKPSYSETARWLEFFTREPMSLILKDIVSTSAVVGRSDSELAIVRTRRPRRWAGPLHYALRFLREAPMMMTLAHRILARFPRLKARLLQVASSVDNEAGNPRRKL